MATGSDRDQDKAAIRSRYGEAISVARSPDLVRAGGRGKSSLAAALTRWTYPAKDIDTARMFAAAAGKLGLKLVASSPYEVSFSYRDGGFFSRRTVVVKVAVTQPVAGVAKSTISVKDPWGFTPRLQARLANDFEEVLMLMDKERR
jgi:hypothetical protein